MRGRGFAACRVTGLIGSDALGTRLRPILATLGASVLAIACGDEEPPTEPPEVSIPSAVSVSPTSATLQAIGETVQLTAMVRDQNGRTMSDAAVSWASNASSIATVSASGLVTATGNGDTRVTASSGTATGTAEVTVRQQVSSVVVSPPNASLAEGDTIRLRAEARDARGNEVAGTEFLWSSADVSVAAVDSTGLVNARFRGTALISAAADTLSGTAQITVTLPHVPRNPAVDEGTSHSLQTIEMRLPHGRIRRGRSGTSHAVVYADLNRDGHPDLFYAPLNRTLNPLPPEVHLNDGAYNFQFAPGFLSQSPPTTVHARKALTGDFNGDAHPDIFVLATGYDVDPFPGENNYVLLSSSNGYVRGAGLDSIVGYHHGGASADIDADGDLDVFVTENFKGPFFLLNNGSGTFRKDTERIRDINYEAGIYTAELVDVDQDGYVDLLVAGHEYTGFRTQVLWGGERGVYSSVRGTLLPLVAGNGVVVDIDVADTDGDGDRDIILNRTGDFSGAGFYDGYYVQLLSQTGARSFTDVTASHFADNQDLRAEWFDWIRVYDMDDDGDLDVVVDDVESFATRGQGIWRGRTTGPVDSRGSEGLGGPSRPIRTRTRAVRTPCSTRDFASIIPS